MIYTVGGIKGGSGKSTIATNLAVYLANLGRDVLLVDADDQETSTDFSAWRNQSMNGNAGYTAIQLSGEAVRTEVKKLAPRYADVVIDTGGRDTSSQRAAMSVSDLYVVPFVPRSFDVWTLEKVTELFRDMKHVNPKLYGLSFLNRTDSRGTDNEDAANYLRESKDIAFIDVLVCNRKAFANAATNGQGIFEVKPRDPKAEQEFKALVDELERIGHGLDAPVVGLQANM